MAMPDAEVRVYTPLAVTAALDESTDVPTAAAAARSALSPLPGMGRGDAFASAVCFSAAPHRLAVSDPTGPGPVLDNALQVPLSAPVSSIIGQPSPAVGMTGRLSCRYGIASSPGGYAVELSITSYRDAAAAAARVGVTVDALRTHGFSPAAP